MHTIQRMQHGEAQALPLDDASVQLVVTSPPYPMIQMWDAVFADQDPTCEVGSDAWAAFEAMHRVLDGAWAEVARVLVPGGYACINIGDAVRTVDGWFRCYPNHVRVMQAFVRVGLDPLPAILWRKPTNAPNKFMGSGMLPAGAYVTYEHEHILVLRKPGKRRFEASDAARRRRSAYFWEERNLWFSDVWTDIRGTVQALEAPTRSRSGGFPPELPFRLIHMYSLQEDTVLDPFMGLGTTLFATAASGRNGVGIERSADLVGLAQQVLLRAPAWGRRRRRERLEAHALFIRDREPRHLNVPHGTPVVTGQERDLCLPEPLGVTPTGDQFEVAYRLWNG